MKLIALSYSPWSERARWALDHHGLAYDEVEHQIMLGEPLLRWRVGRWRGRVSVPVLVEEDGRVTEESYAIARRVEALGRGTHLFAGDPAVFARWDRLSNAALAAGRRLLTERIAADPEAKRENLPAPIPDPMRPLLEPVADLGLTFFRRKYGLAGVAGAEQELVEALEELRTALGGRRHILQDFSFTDIAMAVVLQYVEPVSDEYIPLGPANRRCWAHPGLATKFGDLVEWRDWLYATHR